MDHRIHPTGHRVLYWTCTPTVVLFIGAFALAPAHHRPYWVIAFLVTVFLAILLLSWVFRRCRCPECRQAVPRDKKLGAQGHFRYTCPHCRIVWIAMVRPGGGSGIHGG